jgi:hypothetical protein
MEKTELETKMALQYEEEGLSYYDLYIELDCCSSPFWAMDKEDGELMNCCVEDYPIGKELSERLTYWELCHAVPPSCTVDPDRILDRDAFSAYGHALAIDVRNALPDRFKVYFNKVEIKKHFGCPLLNRIVTATDMPTICSQVDGYLNSDENCGVIDRPQT